MLTIVLMGMLVLGIAFCTLWGVRFDADKDSFMSIEDTVFLRGFWCIIVALVHVPELYQNKIQDMLGSFAYIGVTFYFMTSAYGLKYSLQNKPGYMNHFWRGRLPSILIPAIIANALSVFVKMLEGEEVSAFSFINITNWVKVLLLYYLIFWIVYFILPKIIRAGYWQDVLMCSIVFGCSLIDRLTDFKITSIWIVEPLGFAYGIMAANHSERIKKYNRSARKWLPKSIMLMLVSGILGIAYLKFKPVLFWGDYFLKIVLGIAILAFMYTLISKLKVGNRLNTFLGSISYEVYLIHGSVFSFLCVINKNMNSGVFVVLALIISVAISWGLKICCRPLINLFKNKSDESSGNGTFRSNRT